MALEKTIALPEFGPAYQINNAFGLINNVHMRRDGPSIKCDVHIDIYPNRTAANTPGVQPIAVTQAVFDVPPDIGSTDFLYWLSEQALANSVFVGGVIVPD